VASCLRGARFPLRLSCLSDAPVHWLRLVLDVVEIFAGVDTALIRAVSRGALKHGLIVRSMEARHTVGSRLCCLICLGTRGATYALHG
jgi:hypothetical protein